MFGRYCLSILTAILLIGQTTSTLAQTAEKDASLAGDVVGIYNRARFLCLANGIPMPTFEKAYPDLVERAAALKSKYPESFAFGEAHGVEIAKMVRTFVRSPREVWDVQGLSNRIQKSKMVARDHVEPGFV